MGYTTTFKGKFNLDKPLTIAQLNYLKALNKTRRMKRDAKIASKMPDPKREAVGLPIGEFGEFFVGSESNYGQVRDASIIDYNVAPNGELSLWCGWAPTEDGTAIEWDEGEKFYDYVNWLKFIIAITERWGLRMNGTVTWEGEERSDIGKLDVVSNVVTVLKGRITHTYGSVD